MATLKHQKARKFYICSKCEKPIKPGEQYYRFSLTRFQKLKPRCIRCKPKRAEMTTSDFFCQMYDIEDAIAAISVDDLSDFESEIADVVGQLETLRDEQEEKRSNMPDQLQDAPTGELLQERYEEVDGMIDELQGIDLEVDEELNEEETEARMEEIAEEIISVGYNGP